MRNDQKKPNLIYILADDMGYGDVSALNEKSAFQTPAFDAMCQNGMAFTDAHASSAVCTPSRYSILTGRYNWRSRLKEYVLGGYSPPLIEKERLTLPGMLRQNGYRTAMVGKWHLGMQFGGEYEEAPAFAPCEGVDYAAPITGGPVHRGFDYYYGISASLDMPPYVYIENDRFTALPTHDTENTGKRFWRKGPTADNFVHQEVLLHLTEKALGCIREMEDDPFFLYFPLPAPHTPILPGEGFQGASDTNEYGDFVLMCDDVVSQIRACLRELGIEKDTILVYTSDNGCSPEADFAELAQYGHNPSYVFRGHKADIYEGGHRIPLLVEWPDAIHGGSRCNETVCLTDIMATMANLLDIPLPDSAAEDSVSNLALWRKPDAGPVRKFTVHQSIDGSLAIRANELKLEMCPGSGGWSFPKPGEETPDMPSFQLYDLTQDVGERHNIIEERPAMAACMRQQLADIVRLGRSTPGAPQKNNGEDVWQAVRWLQDGSNE